MDGRLARRPFLRHSDPVRPTVRPGAAVLRRDAAHLQVGTSPGLVIRDHPGLYPLLRGLDGTRDFETLRRHVKRDLPELGTDVAEALAPLIAVGAVVDGERARRSSTRIGLSHDGPSRPLAATLRSLLADLKLTVAPDPDLVIAVSSGEPSRHVLANAASCGITHLVVVLDGDVVRLGPLVVPGRTPCVECLDLHRAGWDPTWPALLPQFGRPVALGVSPLTQYAAVAEIAAEVARFAAGERPRTATQILTVEADRTVTAVASPGLHPRCPCSLLIAA